MLNKNRKKYEPENFSRFSISKPLIRKIKGGTVALCIDLWQYSDDAQDAVINIVNSMPSIEYVLLATYGWGSGTNVRDRRQGIYNIDLRDKIKKPSIELVPYVDEVLHEHYDGMSAKGIELELENFFKWFSFSRIIMMGGAYGLCLHNRAFGLNNLANYMAAKKIETRLYAHPSAITLPDLNEDSLDNSTAEERLEEIIKNVGPGDTALLKKVIRMTTEEKKNTYTADDGFRIDSHTKYKILDRADNWSPSEIDNHPVFLYKTLPEPKKTII